MKNGAPLQKMQQGRTGYFPKGTEFCIRFTSQNPQYITHPDEREWSKMRIAAQLPNCVYRS